MPQQKPPLTHVRKQQSCWVLQGWLAVVQQTLLTQLPRHCPFTAGAQSSVEHDDPVGRH